MSHLVPQGRPFALSFFLASVELISNLIRPLTLSLRLSIKITTGHIFITLIRVGLCGFLTRFRFFSFFVLRVVLGLYFLFEFAICVIQAFVFRLLLVQYIEESSFVE